MPDISYKMNLIYFCNIMIVSLCVAYKLICIGEAGVKKKINEKRTTSLV